MDVPAPQVQESFGFAELLAPLPPDEFHRDILGKRPVHVAGAPGKFAFAMSWDILNRLLDQSALWTPHTLQLAINGGTVAPSQYARDGVGRDGKPAQLVDFARVRELARQGASLLLVDIETLSPGAKKIFEVLSREPGGRVQCNLYCSWQRRQAFDVHFDTHDVFALQIAGDKAWRIYQRHFKDPINHPAFKQLTPAYHHANKGPVVMEVMMRPGDLLYIPRGFYHDALAESGATVHLTYSVTRMTGLDVISMLFEHAVMDEVFRAALPDPGLGGGAALDEHLMRIAGRLRELLRDPEVRAHLDQRMRDFRLPVQRIRLPDDPGRGAAQG